ncbi:uncharacterized protein LAJ45_10512 [Morchella importuna]|uniref:uncharacterized protein n=1 Tax=Morchella importuna TaxID=1174673 RepID=UPI001E8DCD6F|nr:uncharacterized protein LAJ45_10512 [Morchella importuna]KAH8145542.1 hypothetical protein LAJ45_10512 [Morchella importuna]
MEDDRANRLFQAAVQRGNKEDIYELPGRGAGPNFKGRDGRTALHKAALLGRSLVVQELLKLKSIDVNCQERTLHDAVCGKDVPTIELLLERGVDVNCKDSHRHTPLHHAVLGKDVPTIELLLERGANINCQGNWGRTPLHDTVLGKDVPTIELLLEQGADVNRQGISGDTPLHHTVLGGDVPTIELLLGGGGGGGDVNCQDNEGRTPLHVAESRTSLPAIGVLLENGARILCKDKNGFTPLHSVTEYLETLIESPKDFRTNNSIEECRRVIDEVMRALPPRHPAIKTGLKVLEVLGVVDNLPEAHATNSACPAKKPESSGWSCDKSLDQEVEYNSSATLSNEESPEPKIRNDTVSNAPLSDDFTGEISSSSSKGCITFELSQGDESGSTSENDCEDIDDGTNEDEGTNQYEDADEDDEGDNGDDSDYHIEVSDNLEGTGAYRYHGGNTSNPKGKGKLISKKRSMSQSFGGQSNDQEDDESSNQPSRRRKG